MATDTVDADSTGEMPGVLGRKWEKISVEQAAAYLECTEQKLVELVLAGEIPAARIGEGWVILASSFYRFVEETVKNQTLSRYDDAHAEERGRADAEATAWLDNLMDRTPAKRRGAER